MIGKEHARSFARASVASAVSVTALVSLGVAAPMLAPTRGSSSKG
jgi:hypothetical protein